MYTRVYTHFGVAGMKELRARDTSPVRLRPADKKYVERLARESKMTQTEVLHLAVELLKREKQFQDMRDTYGQLSPVEAEQMRAESLMFDKSSGDGIE